MQTTQSLCLHPTTRAVAMPRESRHFRRLECAHCGAFLRFLPWPEHLRQRMDNLRRLRLLYKSGLTHQLSIEDEMFIDEAVLDTGGCPSPAQQARFDEICVRLGIGQNGADAQEKKGGDAQ